MILLSPVRAVAADQGWQPVVVQTGNVGGAQIQQYQPAQPTFQGAQPIFQAERPAREPAPRPRQPTPPVWRTTTGPAYMPPAAQVSRPTLTEHGLQMPVPQGAPAAPAAPSGVRAQTAHAPIEPVVDARERAVVSGTGMSSSEQAAAPVTFNEPVGAIPLTRALSPADSARLKVAARSAEPGQAAVTMPDSDLAQRYCVNVANAAADARMAWQKTKMAEAEQQLEARIAALEAKTAEYKAWLARRDEFSRKANETLVQIYAQMEPDAGAAQLASMDEETAAAVLAKLDPQSSAAILNEMQADKAARLTATIAGAARVASRKASQQQAAAQPRAADEDPDDPAAQANQGGGR